METFRKLSTKYFYMFLAVIAVLGFILRLYHITYPIGDWHSWRQSDTAAVARNYLRFGIDLLRPRYDDLSNIQSGKDNPMGWRMVEFPMYQGAGAMLVKTIPRFPLEVWLRLLTILASVGTAVLLGIIVSEHIDPFTGLLTALVYAVLPYSIYYGRTILPDPQMVWWSVVSIWLLTRGRAIRWTVFSAIAGALALLSKPMAAFLLVPIPYLIYRQSGISKNTLLKFVVYGAISLIPLLLWRRWILQFPEGIPVSTWLYNGNGIRFKGAWFQWLFATRLGDLILGFWGLMLFGFGLVRQVTKREGWLFRWWAAGVLAYFIVFATGNVQHDYYQILIIPVVAVFVGKGLGMLIGGMPGVSRWPGRLLALVAFIAMLVFSWYTIRTYYWINRPEIVEAGKVADALLPKDAKVIASYNGDTTFLYQTGRQGWPLGFEIDKKISMGATAYVTVSPTDNDGETKDLANRYTVLVRNDKFAIIDLTKSKFATVSAGK